MYTEQFLRQLISFFLTANQFEKNSLIELRAAVLSLLAIFASHHSDIQKRIGEKQSRSYWTQIFTSRWVDELDFNWNVERLNVFFVRLS